MRKLYCLIEQLVNEHVGGEPFFNALDENIRNDMEYCSELKYLYYKQARKTLDILDYPNIIVSGSFGKVFQAYCQEAWKRPYGITLCVDGGLRKQDLVLTDSQRVNIIGRSFIFFDDSFYSGTTFKKVQEEVIKCGGALSKAFVVYDGSKEQLPYVCSLYRYYETGVIKCT